ncbi:hypothetical protein Q9966_003954 [Columba livia]|nr:hypothetical protein Q9966_003954 [Columba livia]
MLGSAWSQQHPASQTSPLGRKKDTAQLGSTTGDPGPSVGTKSITGLVGTSISTPKRSSRKDKDCRGLKTELFPSLHGPSICF